jgi:hypothetical protein
MLYVRRLCAAATLATTGLLGACAHTAAVASKSPCAAEPSAVANAEDKLEIAPPPGWFIPDALVPAGGLRLTVGGLPPAEAPASLMARAVDKDEPFEEFCQHEFAAMAQSFPEATLTKVTDLEVPGKRSVTMQVLGPTKGAIMTLIEEPDYYVWFAVMISDPAYLTTAPTLYRESLLSYRSTTPAPAAEAEASPLPDEHTLGEKGHDRSHE